MDNNVDPFKVYVRIRPLLSQELKLVNDEIKKGKAIPQRIVTSENNILYLRDPNNPELYGRNVRPFTFDQVFTEKDNNKKIFDSIMKKLIDNCLQGYNSTALAYGVTGAGKTHTMFGDMYINQTYDQVVNDPNNSLMTNSNSNNSNPNSNSNNQNQNSNSKSPSDPRKQAEKGISMYAIDYLFSKISNDKEKTYTIKISYLELYNEQVIDLLTNKPSCEGIMIVEDPVKGVLVPDLSEIVVTSSNQVYNYIIKGNLRRTKGSTFQNQFSSRSHAILEIYIEQYHKNLTKGDVILSKMLLVDLAGSEKGGKEKGIRRDEGANINRSLLALGNCINILSMNDKNNKNVFVPYRDSKLTRLLKDSLGGNIATVMIACVSPSPLNYEETHSTIKYASLASKIEKKVTKNIKDNLTSSQYRELVLNLKGEILKLKEIIRELHMKLRNKGKIDDDQKSNFNSSDYKSTCKNEDFLYEDFFINNSNNINSNSNNHLGGNNNNNFNLGDDSSNVLDNSQCHNDFLNYNIMGSDSRKNINFISNNSINNSNNICNVNINNNCTCCNCNCCGGNNNFNSNLDDLKIELNFNNEIYENLSISNLDDKSEKELDDIEKKLDNLYKDKTTIEEKLKKYPKQLPDITEKYDKIKTYYEKYSISLNEILSQNTEQNITLKYKTEELEKQMEQNNMNIENYQILIKDEKEENEKNRLIQKIDLCKQKNNEIDSEIKKNKEILENCNKIKKFLKKIFSKYISFIQINDNSGLKKKYNSLLNEKKELEIKTKTFQECFNSIVKENDKKATEILTLNNEIDKMKLIVDEKDKTIEALKEKINDLMTMNKNLCEKYQAPFSKSMLNFFDEYQSRSTSKNKNHRIHQRSTSIKNLLQQPKTNHREINKININRNASNYINSQVPIITAFIKEGDVYSHDNNLANSIMNLKNNLSAKNDDTRSPKHKSLNKIKKKTISQSRKKKNGKDNNSNINNINSINNNNMNNINNMNTGNINSINNNINNNNININNYSCNNNNNNNFFYGNKESSHNITNIKNIPNNHLNNFNNNTNSNININNFNNNNNKYNNNSNLGRNYNNDVGLDNNNDSFNRGNCDNISNNSNNSINSINSNNSKKSNECSPTQLKNCNINAIDNKIYSTEPNTRNNNIQEKRKFSNSRIKVKDNIDYENNNNISQSMNFNSLVSK